MKDKKKEFTGIWIPAEILCIKELTLIEKSFLMEIDYLDNEKGCYASNKYFAEIFQITNSRASQVVNSLIKKEYICAKYEYQGKKIKKRILNILKGVIKYSKGGYLENAKERYTLIDTHYKKKRSDSKESPKIFKVHPLTKFWNEMSNTRKHKETSKIHSRINQLIKDLKKGKFYTYYWDDDFLKQNRLNDLFLKKEWTNKEIKEILLQLNKLYEDRYWPYDKSKLPRDFETMLYNKRTGKSFFLMCINNPPQLLKKEKKSKPKNLEWYNKYRELFGIDTNQKFIIMFNQFYVRVQNILKNVEPLYRHTSFSRYVGSVRRPHIFFELHMQWLKKQTKLFPGLLKGIPWQNFCSYVLQEYNFCLAPDDKQVRKLKREYKRACQRIEEKKERRI